LGGSSYKYKLETETFVKGTKYRYDFTLSEPGPKITPQPPTSSFDGMTNCYMVAPGDSVTFRVSRAYTFDPDAKGGKGAHTTMLHVDNTAPYTGKFKVKILWQDATDLISNLSTSSVTAIPGSGNSAKVTVQTASGKTGNAVVAIYKESDTTTPVWSYHIWVTNPADIQTWTNPNSTIFVFMDRNLGATAAANSIAGRGLLYQWGRKDPFPGGPNKAENAGAAGYAVRSSFRGINGDSKVVTGTAYANSTDKADQIIASIEYPTVYFSNVSNGDWLSTEDDELWNVTTSGKQYKTIYDPCPSSWRVPVHVGNQGSETNSPWYGLASSSLNDYYGEWSASTPSDTGGMNFRGKSATAYTDALYPAAGYRDDNGGDFGNGGITGNYWGATIIADNHAHYMYFGSTGYVYVNYRTFRACGFSVRCVQESLSP
jgi:hypothetical protein